MIAILSILLFKYINSDYMYQDPLLFPSEFHINESTDFSEICFYSIDKTKCPSNINPSNFFGPGEYNSKILSFSKNSVIIHIAESIFTTEPITFSAPAHFYIVGKQIKGKIEVQGNSSIDFQDPTKTEIKLYWSANTKEIPQIKTMLSPKSMFIEIINQNENAYLFIPVKRHLLRYQRFFSKILSILLNTIIIIIAPKLNNTISR